MELIADILLVAGAIGAGLYCHVLARRLSRFNDLENGVGGAVAVLSAQVDDLAKTLQAAQSAAGSETRSLDALTQRAESVANRLELLVASMHDLDEPENETPSSSHISESADEGESGPVFRRHASAGERGQG